ncbi:unnamed protein product [Cylicocyclus nassatus]|uniref:Uncharacterized protein n=1 Tax=Cylicocyclus nassatus TaxID=53992 RepID=A0AA36M8M2_CYLNA|nr:unnamed protein product [Cylicocyclus nassatus]
MFPITKKANVCLFYLSVVVVLFLFDSVKPDGFYLTYDLWNQGVKYTCYRCFIEQRRSTFDYI